MNIRFKSLAWVSADTCHAVFHLDGEPDLETTFTLQRGDGRVGVDLSPDLFWTHDRGSAEQTREVLRIVIAFCLQAQGEPPQPPRPPSVERFPDQA